LGEFWLGIHPTAQAPGSEPITSVEELQFRSSIAVHFGIWPRTVEQTKLYGTQKRAKLRTTNWQAIKVHSCRALWVFFLNKNIYYHQMDLENRAMGLK